MEIIYDNEMPGEIRQALEPIIDKWCWLCPPWMQRLRIRYIPRSDEEESADAYTASEYRWAVICIKGEWLNNAESREEIVIHELVHLFNAGVIDYVKGELARVLSDEGDAKYRASVLTELTAKNEAFVQDLAWCLVKRG